MNWGVILLYSEPRIFKYSVKLGRITLARLSANCKKRKKEVRIYRFPIDKRAFGYVFSPETSLETTVIPR